MPASPPEQACALMRRSAYGLGRWGGGGKGTGGGRHARSRQQRREKAAECRRVAAARPVSSPEVSRKIVPPAGMRHMSSALCRARHRYVPPAYGVLPVFNGKGNSQAFCSIMA